MQSFGQYYGRRIILGTCSGIVLSSGVSFLGTFRNLLHISTLSSVGLNKRAFLLLPIRFLLQGILYCLVCHIEPMYGTSHLEGSSTSLGRTEYCGQEC